MTFAERMKEARKAKGMTQEQVANLIGVDKTTYCGWEIERRSPKVSEIKKISEALGVQADILLETGFAPKSTGEQIESSFGVAKEILYFLSDNKKMRQLIADIIEIPPEERRKTINALSNYVDIQLAQKIAPSNKDGAEESM